jgi:aldehyde dehydrogenase (NAD+)
VRNASTGEPSGSVPEAAEADVDAAAARRAFDDPSGWSSWPSAERAGALERLAAELETRAQEIGRLVSMQNGMPIALSPIIEDMTPVGTLRYMASLSRWSTTGKPATPGPASSRHGPATPRSSTSSPRSLRRSRSGTRSTRER